MRMGMGLGRRWDGDRNHGQGIMSAMYQLGGKYQVIVTAFSSSPLCWSPTLVLKIPPVSVIMFVG